MELLENLRMIAKLKLGDPFPGNWRNWSEELSKVADQAADEIEKLQTVLKAYEKWEADLILDRVAWENTPDGVGVPEFNWTPGLPFMEVRRFIAERLRQEQPSAALDQEVCTFLGTGLTACTQHVGAAISLIPEGWWWRLSHNTASVTPTNDVAGAPVSNSKMYDFYGSPVGYSALVWENAHVAVALCEALLKARYDLPTAFVVEASATEHNDEASRYQRIRFSRVGRRHGLLKDG